MLSLRPVLNAIFHVIKTACQWRQLPNYVPPCSAVYDFPSLTRSRRFTSRVVKSSSSNSAQPLRWPNRWWVANSLAGHTNRLMISPRALATWWRWKPSAVSFASRANCSVPAQGSGSAPTRRGRRISPLCQVQPLVLARPCGRGLALLNHRAAAAEQAGGLPLGYRLPARRQALGEAVQLPLPQRLNALRQGPHCARGTSTWRARLSRVCWRTPRVVRCDSTRTVGVVALARLPVSAGGAADNHARTQAARAGGAQKAAKVLWHYAVPPAC